MHYHMNKANKNNLVQIKYYEKTRTFDPKSIDDEKFLEIKNEAEKYKRRMLDPTGKSFSMIEFEKRDLIYKAFEYMSDGRNQFNYDSTAKIIFMIQLIDPELKMLEIYYNESNENEISKQIREIFHYYNKNFILREKAYNNYFKLIEDPFAEEIPKKRTRK